MRPLGSRERIRGWVSGNSRRDGEEDRRRELTSSDTKRASSRKHIPKSPFPLPTPSPRLPSTSTTSHLRPEQPDSRTSTRQDSWPHPPKQPTLHTLPPPSNLYCHRPPASPTEDQGEGVSRPFSSTSNLLSSSALDTKVSNFLPRRPSRLFLQVSESDDGRLPVGLVRK